MVVFVVMLSGMILMGGVTLFRDVGALYGFFGEDVMVKNDDFIYIIWDKKGNKIFLIYFKIKEVIVDNKLWYALNDMDENIQKKFQQLNLKVSDRVSDLGGDLTLDDCDLIYIIWDENRNKIFLIYCKIKEVIVDNKLWQIFDNMDEEIQQRFWQLNSKVFGGLCWMILIGFGAYLVYVLFGAVLFEWIMVSIKVVGTVVFVIYFCDVFGYIGSIGIQLYKDFGQVELDYFEFLWLFIYFMVIFGIVFFILSVIYFYGKSRFYLLVGLIGLVLFVEND